MKRKLIIDGNSVYELDEECMLKKRVEKEKEKRKCYPEICRMQQAKRREWE